MSMRDILLAVVVLGMPTAMPNAPLAARPTPDEIRKDMGIPSTTDVRGQRDAVGYATTREAMAKVWDAAAQGPEPEDFGVALPPPGVAAVIGPHDDYVYAARVYRRLYPLVAARTVGGMSSELVMVSTRAPGSTPGPTIRMGTS